METENSKNNKETTPSAIMEFRLLESQKDYKKLLKLQDLGRILYNACLGESLRRLKLVKTNKLYKETIAIPKDTKENKDKRKENFKYLNDKYGFTNASIQSFAVKCKNESKFLNQLGVHVIQKIATTAFRAVQKVAFGRAKKVKFKRKGEFVTLEGKDNKTFLRYSNAYALIGDMTIKCKIRKNDPYFEHFLKHRIKFCRLVSRKFNNKYKFFLQVVFEGKPYEKVKLGNSHTSIDVGPSTIAKVNDKSATLKRFCEEIVFNDKEIKKLQRKASKKLKLANPQNYDEKGAVKKGSKKWNKTNSYIKLQNKIADMKRRQAYHRKQLHGKEVNLIIRESRKVSAEKLSYKAFQKLYGRSVASFAPSQFITRLKDKLKLLGGEFQEIHTYTTKLSQTCICGNVKKKKLSERTHKCEECGLVMQRDLLSAYLGLFITKNGKKLKVKEAKKNYKNYEPILNKCIKDLKELKKTNPSKVYSTFGI